MITEQQKPNHLLCFFISAKLEQIFMSFSLHFLTNFEHTLQMKNLVLSYIPDKFSKPCINTVAYK
jgi:hypothetical protein